MPRFTYLVAGVLASVLLAWPSLGDWLKDCVGTDNALCTAANTPWACCIGAGTGTCDNFPGNLTHSLGGSGKIACHRYSGTADDDPSILQVTDCDNVDVIYIPDFDGDGADSAGTVSIYLCPSIGNAVLNTEAERLNACQPYGGGTTLSAADAEQEGIGAGYIWFDVEGWTDDAEIQAICNSGPQ